MNEHDEIPRYLVERVRRRAPPARVRHDGAWHFATGRHGHYDYDRDEIDVFEYSRDDGHTVWANIDGDVLEPRETKVQER